MKVKAIAQGHYGVLRKPGEVFTIKDTPVHKDHPVYPDGFPKAFSRRWMKRVKPAVPVTRPELDDDGKPVVLPRRRHEPVRNIRDVNFDDFEYEDDGKDDFDEADVDTPGQDDGPATDEPKEPEAGEKKPSRRRGRSGPKPEVHE